MSRWRRERGPDWRSWRRTFCKAAGTCYTLRHEGKGIHLSLFLAAIPALVFALKISELDINAGLLFIGSSPPGAPSPLVQTIGASLVIQSDGPFFIEPTIEFFGSYYQVIGSRTVPAPYESGTSFLTLASLITVQSGLIYPITKNIDMGGALGVDFLIRFPFEFQNTGADTGDGLTYFYSQGRFIYPETRFITRWHVVDGVTLAFTLRAMYPLFHLWDGEGLPFYDQFMTAFNIGFVIALGGKPAAKAPAAQAPAAEAPATEAPTTEAPTPQAPAAAK